MPVLPWAETPTGSPPKTPRELTPSARRAIWTEPRVRRWWLLAIIIFVLFAAYTIEQVLIRNDEVKLIKSGMFITARLLSAENRNKDQQTQPTDLAHLMLNLPGGAMEVTGYLYNPWMVGHEVTVHVDPQDHNHWTDRTEPTSVLDSLFVGILVSPLVPGLFIVAYLKMRATQQVWQNGTAQLAVISERKQSPIAPMSYAIRCSLQVSRDKKLFNVFVPKTGSGLKAGDLIWVMMPQKKGPPLSGLWMGCGSVQA